MCDQSTIPRLSALSKLAEISWIESKCPWRSMWFLFSVPLQRCIMKGAQAVFICSRAQHAKGLPFITCAAAPHLFQRRWPNGWTNAIFKPRNCFKSRWLAVHASCLNRNIYNSGLDWFRNGLGFFLFLLEMLRPSCLDPKRSKRLTAAGWCLTSRPPVTTGWWTRSRTWACNSAWRP